MDTNTMTTPQSGDQNQQEPPTTKLEAEQIMEQAEAGNRARSTAQAGQPQMPTPPAPPTMPTGGPIPPIPPTPNMPAPPPPFMGEQVKGDEVKGEQTKSEAGQKTKSGETRFATANLPGLPLLNLSSFSGDITVHGAEQDYISVRVLKDDELLPLEDAAEVSYSTEGELMIKAQPLANINRQVRGLRDTWRATKGNFFDGIGNFVEQVSRLGGGWGNVDFDVTVPLRCNLELGNTSGEIEASNVEGNISLKTVSGEVTGKKLSGNLSLQSSSGELAANELSGTIYLRTISGDIEAQRMTGNLVIQTASGDVELNHISGKLGFKSISGGIEAYDANLNSFYLSSTSGDLELYATLHQGDYEVRTVSGDTKLHVQDEFTARLTGRTVSGDFKCDLPYIHADEDWRTDTGELQSGEHEQTDEAGNYSYQYRQPGYRYEYQWDPRTGRGRGHGHSEERRRRRNRWEFLIGDPATAEQGQTRMRVRTTSGDLEIKPGAGKVKSESQREMDADMDIDSSDFTRPLRYSDAGNIARMTDENYEPDEDEEMDQMGAAAQRQAAEHQRMAVEAQRRAVEQQRMAAAAPRSAEAKDRTRADILQAVERKQISVEEAMRLLRQLD